MSFAAADWIQPSAMGGAKPEVECDEPKLLSPVPEPPP
jgi:hypothetical protein